MPDWFKQYSSHSLRVCALVGTVALSACVTDSSPPTGSAPALPSTTMIVIDVPDDGSSVANSGAKGQPLLAARGLPVPMAATQHPLAQMPWQTRTDGRRQATVQVRSAGAAALRAALTLDRPVRGLELVFLDTAGAVITRVPATAVYAASKDGGRYWSPFVDGESVTVALVMDAVEPPHGVLTVPLVSRRP